MLQKPAAGAGFCNILKYKADTFYLSRIQKPAPELGPKESCFETKISPPSLEQSLTLLIILTLLFDAVFKQMYQPYKRQL